MQFIFFLFFFSKRKNLNLLILCSQFLLSLLVACSLAAPAANPQVPASTYLMNYDPYSIPFIGGYNAAEIRSLSAISTTLTDATQAIANFQLLALRQKWTIIICLADPKCPSLPFPAKHPWAPARSYPVELFDSENVEDEAQDPFYRTETVPIVDDDVEAKSTAILTSAANFQMSQWIWRWNIILCLVNPSCPNVNIPATTKLNTRSDYPWMLQVNMERLMALNQDPQRGVFIPISFAPQ